jgi:hypothetical protein
MELGSTSIGPAIIEEPPYHAWTAGLDELYRQKNGFYAFGGALLVRPIDSKHVSMPRGIMQWNEPALWRTTYGDLIPEAEVFFAEDAFGNQFSFDPKAGFCFFDAETGDKKPIADSVSDWASAVLVDWDYLSGYRPAEAWQKHNRSLMPGERLIPKHPIVLGGSFEISNLMAWPDDKGMRSRGFLARQIKDLPDGSQISFRLIK